MCSAGLSEATPRVPPSFPLILEGSHNSYKNKAANSYKPTQNPSNHNERPHDQPASPHGQTERP